MKSDLYTPPQSADENIFYLFLFSKIKGLSSKNTIALLKKYGSPQKTYYTLLNNPQILPKKINTLISDKHFLNKTRQHFESLDENYISILDKAYPKNLKNIYDPPLFLFYRGNLDLLKNDYLVTMVGSRTTTTYHTNCVKNIFENLTNTPLIIVSGLARGIDALCHRQALEKNLPTIAVLGSGLKNNIIYPKDNIKLAEDIILNKGLLLSEQSSQEKTQLYHFPKRNRILAGLSLATIVISGAKKSGTLITAQVSLDEGREVLALPANINLRLSQGPNKLIKEGAGLLDSAEDILKIYQLEKNIQPKNILFKNKQHAKIYSLLQTEPMKLIDLSDKLDLSLNKISALVSEMEIIGLIKLNNLNQLEII